MTISLGNDLDVTGLVCSVVSGFVDCWRHWSCVRLSLEDGLGDEAVVSDLWFVVCLLWQVGDE